MCELPAQSWSASVDWLTLQNKQTGNMTVLTESIVLVPDMCPTVDLYINAVLSNTVTYSFTLSNLVFAVNVAQATNLLTVVPAATVSPVIMTASQSQRYIEVRTSADGTTSTSNVVNGTGKVGIAVDFSGDLFTKLSAAPNVSGKDFDAQGAQYTYGMSVAPDKAYGRWIQRVQLLPQVTFSPDSVYLVTRLEMASSVTLTPPAGYSVVTLSPNEMNGNGLRLPAYSAPFIDTCDSSVECIHIYMQASSPSGITFKLVPNRMTDLFANEVKSNGNEATWLASVLYSPQGTGSEFPMFTVAQWPVSMSWYVVAPPRITCFKGLDGNRITMQASAKGDAPPQCIAPLIYYSNYTPYKSPVEVVEEVNDVMSSESNAKRVWLEDGDRCAQKRARN